MTDIINRRDALKLISLGSLGLVVVDHLVGHQTKKGERTAYQEQILNKEQLKKIDEIGKIREHFNLPPIPQCLSDKNIQKAQEVVWKSEDSFEISNEYPEAHKSAGELIIWMAKALYGKNAGRLVKKVAPDPHIKSSGGFHESDSSITLDPNDPSDDIHQYSIVHELAHAHDPRLRVQPIYPTVYPTNELINTTHGVWTILSQADQIKDQFLNNINEYNMLFIMKGLGEGIATIYMDQGSLKDQINPEGEILIMEVVNEVLKKHYPQSQKGKFTKKVCAEIGTECFYLILSDKLRIQGNLLNNWYASKMEWAFIEIYGVMFGRGQRHPEAIGNNPVVQQGITQILKSISGEENIDLEEIRYKTTRAPQYVTDLYNKEIEIASAPQIIPPVSIQTPTSDTISTQDVVLIQEQLQEEKSQQQMFSDFFQFGVFPPHLESLPKDQKELMKSYAQALSTVFLQYPEIQYGLNSDDMSFDPDLHIWETNEIAKAFNTNVVWDLITEPRLIPENIDDIKRRIKVLKNFANSPAFGSRATFSSSFIASHQLDSQFISSLTPNSIA